MTTPNLLALIGRDTPLRRTCARNGGEYSGPCPLCRLGTDRFKVWPEQGRWACLGAKAGRSGCDLGGDAIDYLRQRDRLTYREACERLGVESSARGGGGASTQRRRDSAECAEKSGATGKREGALPTSPFPSFPPSSSAHSAESLRLCVEAPPPCVEPPPTWQARAAEWAETCAARLWTAEGERARTWLHGRGLGDDVLAAFGLGYHAADTYEDHARWGLVRTQGGAKAIWLPRGITIPWRIEGRVWRVNIRRPLTPAQMAAGQAKYIGPAGFGNGLYNADALAARPQRPVVLVEGELDALTIVQACGDTVAAVATGSTGGARRDRWVAALCTAPCVLLAFDVDPPRPDGGPGAGDQAAAWWANVLPNARRWRPWRHDVNSLPDPALVRRWVEQGVREREREREI